MSFSLSPQMSRNSLKISNSPGFKSSTMDFSGKDMKRSYRKSLSFVCYKLCICFVVIPLGCCSRYNPSFFHLIYMMDINLENSEFYIIIMSHMSNHIVVKHKYAITLLLCFLTLCSFFLSAQ